VLNAARFVDPSRFRVSVCIADDDGPIARELQRFGVPVTLLGRRGRLHGYGRFARHLARTRPHILHASLGGRAYRRIARLMGCPRSILHFHGPPAGLADHAGGGGRHLWRMIAGADAVLACSHALARELAGLVPDLDGFMQVNHYGIDPTPFSPSSPAVRAGRRRSMGLPADPFLLAFVGRLVPQKGIRELVAVTNRVLAERCDVHLAVAGDGPLRSEFARLDPAVRSRVHLLGEQQDSSFVLSVADALVVPSAWEPFGIVNLEAMAAGLPVAAFAVDGIPEVVRHDETGLMAPPSDIAGLAAHVIHLADDPALRQRLGAAGLLRMHTYFDARTMASRLEVLYSGLLEA
jgi:glycosyltransferase involved in cell wall biosynthesis